MAQGDDSYEQSVSSPEPTAAVAAGGMAAGGVAGSVVAGSVVEAAFAAAAVGLCVLDPVGRILRANPRWLSWMGTSLEAAQGRSVWELFPEAPPGLRALHERVRGGETLALPAIRRVVDDRAAWLEGRLSPVQLPGGVGVLVVVIDVTERRREEDALRGSEERLRVFVEHAPAAIAMLDREMRFLAVSRRFAGDVHLRQEDLLGRDQYELLPTVGRWREAHQRCLAGAVERCDEDVFRGPDGALVCTRWELLPWRDGAGVIGGIMVLSEDITERKRVELERARLLEEVRRAASEAQRSNAQLEAVFQGMSDGVVVYDMDGGVVLVNEAEARINGYPSRVRLMEDRAAIPLAYELSDLEGRAVPPADWPSARALRGESIAGWELRGRRVDTGQERLFSYHAAPIGDERGRQVLALVVRRDITDQKRAEVELRRSEQRFRALADAMPQMVAGFTRDGTPDYVNDQWTAFSGLGLAESARAGWQGIVHRDDVGAAAACWHEARATRAPQQVELRYRAADGRFRWFLGRLAPVRDAAGEVVRFVGAAMDIDDRKRAEAERERLVHALEESDRRKNDFLALLSHELRNPLAPIGNALYLLDRLPPGGARAAHAREVIQRQVGQLTKLVDDLLDISRINYGKIALERRRLDAREVVACACEDARASCLQRGIALEVDVAGSPLWLDADPTRLAQVVGNLLSNAVKFTPPGGRVEVSLGEEEGACQLRVRDTGVGIEPELLERIFEPFAQAERTRGRTHGGIGLGLSLVRSLVALHGGTARARSEGPGRGAELVVRLPLATGAALSPAPAPAAATPGLSILVVEDNPDAGETLGELLQDLGHRIRVAVDGRSGVAALREAAPDAIICDVGLPDFSGYEVVRQLRQLRDGGAVFAVALTGYAQPEDVRRALDAGFDAHLAKPPPMDELLRLLARAAARRDERQGGTR